MIRQRTPCLDLTSAAAITMVALALGGCPPKPGPEPMEPPGNQPMTGGTSGAPGELVPGQTAVPGDGGTPSPDPNEPPAPGPPQPAPPPGAVDPSKPQ